MFLQISSSSITNCVSQDLFSLKPCCSSNSMLELAKCLVKFDLTMCSSTLHRTPMRDMGRCFAGSDLSPFKNGGYVRKLPGVKRLLLWIFYVFYVLCLLCLCTHLFIRAQWSPAGKALTSYWYPGSGVVLDFIDS